MATTYLSCAETAKLVRQALKEAFPGVKFSVRSSTYSMGASIGVQWTDGPTEKEVNAVAKVFEGAYFDGMTDYEGTRYHQFDGEPVHFGADHVMASRSYFDAAIAAAIVTVSAIHADELRQAGGAAPTVAAYRAGACWNMRLPFGNADSVQELINRALYERGVVDEVQESPTVKRVTPAGDDREPRP